MFDFILGVINFPNTILSHQQFYKIAHITNHAVGVIAGRPFFNAGLFIMLRVQVPYLFGPTDHLVEVTHENCLRNLRLPLWKCRTSSMPYFIITSRSMPPPQAKPLYCSGLMPPSRSTLGWIMPQPKSSIQPV